MNITFTLSDDPKKSFETYSAALQKKLGGGDPYQVSRELHESNTEVVINLMYDVLPIERKLIPQRLKDIIEMAAQKSTGYLDVGIHGFNSIFHTKNEKSYSECEFAVMKIFRNADNLEITPFYIHVHGEEIEERTLWIKKIWRKATIDYKQIKFMLTKYDLKAIIKAVKETNWGP
jgi:hypothetical protein